MQCNTVGNVTKYFNNQLRITLTCEIVTNSTRSLMMWNHYFEAQRLNKTIHIMQLMVLFTYEWFQNTAITTKFDSVTSSSVPINHLTLTHPLFKNRIYKIMMTMIVSVGWDSVSKLRPPLGLLIIPQIMYENGKPWWNDIVTC